MPARINQLRIGAAILRGENSITGETLPWLRGDAFTLEAELVEIKTKHSLPEGETGRDAFGRVQTFEDRGARVRGIVNLGRVDMRPEGLTARDADVEVTTASSDHLIVDLTAAKRFAVGDAIRFDIDYGALVQAFLSPYVEKHLAGRETVAPQPRRLRLIGPEALAARPETAAFLAEIGDVGLATVVGGAAGPGDLPLWICGERAETWEHIATGVGERTELGLLWLDSELGPAATAEPELLALVGLRTLSRDESNLIRRRGVLALTMEDVDLVEIREAMRQALRRVTALTDGFVMVLDAWSAAAWAGRSGGRPQLPRMLDRDGAGRGQRRPEGDRADRLRRRRPARAAPGGLRLPLERARQRKASVELWRAPLGAHQPGPADPDFGVGAAKAIVLRLELPPAALGQRVDSLGLHRGQVKRIDAVIGSTCSRRTRSRSSATYQRSTSSSWRTPLLRDGRPWSIVGMSWADAPLLTHNGHTWPYLLITGVALLPSASLRAAAKADGSGRSRVSRASHGLACSTIRSRWLASMTISIASSGSSSGTFQCECGILEEPIAPAKRRSRASASAGSAAASRSGPLAEGLSHERCPNVTGLEPARLAHGDLDCAHRLECRLGQLAADK